ncbi:MAG: hypothetical protein OXU72_08445 [Gammaproteobacteria bacterium]|nr:hypothetical protein [Gammaproteobacteria bacterium]
MEFNRVRSAAPLSPVASIQRAAIPLTWGQAMLVPEIDRCRRGNCRLRMLLLAERSKALIRCLMFFDSILAMHYIRYCKFARVKKIFAIEVV